MYVKLLIFSALIFSCGIAFATDDSTSPNILNPGLKGQKLCCVTYFDIANPMPAQKVIDKSNNVAFLCAKGYVLRNLGQTTKKDLTSVMCVPIRSACIYVPANTTDFLYRPYQTGPYKSYYQQASCKGS